MSKENQIEKWKWVVGYEGGYEVSSFGRVRSYIQERRGTLLTEPHILKCRLNHSGYLFVSLHNDRGKKRKLVHRLVLEAFVGPCPEGYGTSHLDETKTNNHIENLKWATCKENNNMPKRLERIGIQKIGKSGYRGVSKIGNRYYVNDIKVKGKRHRSKGGYDNIEDAYEAYKQAYEKYNGRKYID